MIDPGIVTLELGARAVCDRKVRRYDAINAARCNERLRLR